MLCPTAASLPTLRPTTAAVGEYLMMLPQQLESGLLGEEGGEESGQLVGDWIDRVGARGLGLRAGWIVWGGLVAWW